MMRSLFIIVPIFLLSLSVIAQHKGKPADLQGVATPVLVRISEQHIPSFDLPQHGEVSGMNDNKLLYRGFSRDNKLNGDWQSWYPNGQILDSGYLLKGIPTGLWKHWDSSGVLLASRVYDADKFYRVKDEVLRYNSRHQFFPITHLIANSKQNGTTYLSAASSFDVASGSNETSLKNLVLKNSTGQSYSPPFKSCLHHGEWLNYFNNAAVRDSGSYKDGLRDGVWYHRNSMEGNYWIGAYQSGSRIGEWKNYSPANKLLRIIFYDKVGKELRRKEFNY